MLSIVNDRASRLHQAIILRLQQHQHLLLYYLLSHTQVLYYFRLHNIRNAFSPRQDTSKGKGEHADRPQGMKTWEDGGACKPDERLPSARIFRA